MINQCAKAFVIIGITTFLLSLSLCLELREVAQVYDLSEGTIEVYRTSAQLMVYSSLGAFVSALLSIYAEPIPSLDCDSEE